MQVVPVIHSSSNNPIDFEKFEGLIKITPPEIVLKIFQEIEISSLLFMGKKSSLRSNTDVVDKTTQVIIDRARKLGFKGDQANLAIKHLRLLEQGLGALLEAGEIPEKYKKYNYIDPKKIDVVATLENLLVNAESIQWTVRPTHFSSSVPGKTYLNFALGRVNYINIEKTQQVELLEFAISQKDELLVELLPRIYRKAVIPQMIFECMEYPDFIIKLLNENINLEAFTQPNVSKLIANSYVSILEALIERGCKLDHYNVLEICIRSKNAFGSKTIRNHITVPLATKALFLFISGLEQYDERIQIYEALFALGADINGVIRSNTYLFLSMRSKV